MPKFIDIDQTLSAAASADACASIGVQRVSNVVGFGATGNGTTDDTTVIHAARDAAGVAGKVFFPAGTYLVDGLTASVANQTWELADGATIKMDTGATEVLRITGDGVTIEGGVFDAANGTLHDNSQQGIKVQAADLSGADGVTIRNVEVRDSPMYGIYNVNGSRFTATGCRLIDSYGGGIFTINGTSGTVVTDIVMSDNYVQTSSTASSGIGCLGGLSSDPTRPVERIKIIDNTVILPQYVSGTSTSAIGIIQAKDWIISGNYCEGSELGISNAQATRAVISNNVVRKTSAICIEISGTITDCTISGNILDGTETGANGGGILNSTGTVTGLSIVGNTMFGFTGIATGISFGNSTVVDSATISDNVMRADCGTFVGVSFSGVTGNVTISGNVFDAATITSTVRGIQFAQSATNCVIADNVFSSETSGSSHFAITFGAGTVSGISVTGNTFTAGVSAGYAAVASYTTLNNMTFAGNSVDGKTSTFSSGFQLWAAVNGLTVGGNQFTNLSDGAIRLLGSSAVTMQNIKLAGNAYSSVAHRIRNATSGSTVVDSSVVSTDEQVPGVTSTATAAGTTTLTRDSTEVQVFTGSTTQTCKLATTNVQAGHRFVVVNNSSGDVTVQSSGANTIATLSGSTSGTFVALQATPTAAAHWAKVA